MKPLRNHTRFLIRFGAQTALGRSRRPYHGRILDLVCGAGGMFVSSARFVSEHKQQAAASQFQGENRPKDYSRDQTRELSIHGVEKTDETGRLCRLNLAVHGLEGDIRHGGQVNSYCNDPHDAAGRFNVVLAKHANGANVLHLAPEGTTGFRFPVPSSDLMNRFAEFVAPTLVQIHALHRKIQNLRRTRDLLLPRLLSGQVELKTN
jgi:hypothetical protein